MIRVRLREAMKQFEAAYGVRMTYEELSIRTGLSRATLEAMGSRSSYNATLSSIDKICAALECTPDRILEFSNEAHKNQEAAE